MMIIWEKEKRIKHLSSQKAADKRGKEKGLKRLRIGLALTTV